MDCQQYQDALNATAFGAQSGPDAQAFRLHLEVCDACRRELARHSAFLGTLDRQLQAQFEAAPPPDFNARLRRRIAAESERTPRPILNWLPLLAGATALAALLTFLHYQGVFTPHPRQANAVHIASTSGAPPAQAATPDNLSTPPRANSAAASNRGETPSLHSVLATHSSSPALKVRIDRRELYATVRFTEDVAQGRIDARPLVSAAQNTNDPSSGIKPLDVPLIEVRPIDDQNSELRPAMQ
jgi:hypothetical protein